MEGQLFIGLVSYKKKKNIPIKYEIMIIKIWVNMGINLNQNPRKMIKKKIIVPI